MAEDLFIPKLGQTVDEVVLLNWLVEDGTKVDFGDPVLEVETDKAVFSVEANAKGYIHFGPLPMGETVPVLTVVATIGDKEDVFSPDQEETHRELISKENTHEDPVITPQSNQAITTTDQSRKTKVFASPRAKKLANEKRIDLSHVPPTGGGGTRVTEKDVIDFMQQAPKATPIATAMAREVGLDITGLPGTGPNGIIARSDIEKAIKEKISQPSSDTSPPTPNINYAETEVIESVPLRSVRKRIFDHMTASVHSTARVTLTTECDATELVIFREKFKQQNESAAWGFTPGYNDLLGIMVARTLKAFPFMNARLSKDGNSFEILGEVNLGIAVDTERGLLVPVIKEADTKNLREFGTLLRELVKRAQSSQSTPEDLSGGTFTITNLGNFEIDAFTPVINLPEVAILGIGRIHEKVVPHFSEIKIRKMVTLSLVFDHRLIDGAPAARFLQRIKHLLENPLLMLG